MGDGRLKALYALQAGMNARDIQKNQKTDKAINKNNAVGINISKEYYTEQLLQRGWIKGKNEKGEDFHFHTDRYDEFRFYKDGYTLDVFFDIPLDQDPDKLIWGDKRELYVITMARIEFY